MAASRLSRQRYSGRLAPVSPAAPAAPQAPATAPGVSLVGLYWTLAGPVQVLSAQLRSLPMREMYRRAYQATAAQFRPRPATPAGLGASPPEGA
jgi:hypothetical protein